MREAEQKLAEQAKREEWERLRKEEEATRPEAERREIEKETRWGSAMIRRWAF